LLPVALQHRRALAVIALSTTLVVVVGGWKVAAWAHPPTAAVKTSLPAALVASHDAVRLEHLYLTPQHGAGLTSCQAMAARLGFAVPCPDLLPTDATISSPICCTFGNPNVAPLFVLEDHFRAPPGYPVAEPSDIPRGHLVIVATRRTPLSAALTCESTTPAGVGPRIWANPAYWEVCAGGGSNRGHVILEWEQAGIAYSVSLHGDTPENRSAVELIARHLQLVQVN
jgi:hypothetical protein